MADGERCGDRTTSGVTSAVWGSCNDAITPTGPRGDNCRKWHHFGRLPRPRSLDWPQRAGKSDLVERART